MATSLFDDPSMPSFQEYPTARPFLNSAANSSGKPVKAFPESSSQAVLSALKGLQEKIYNLELDRSKAEKNLKDLAAETSVYKGLLAQSQKTPLKTSNEGLQTSPVKTYLPESKGKIKQTSGLKIVGDNTDVSDVTNLLIGLSNNKDRRNSSSEIETQLKNADIRCRLLERQLENMRKMVQVAEKERGDALERQVALERERGRITAENRDTQARLAKLENLNNRYDELASRKQRSDIKVKQLEDQLQLEEHQRKLLSDKTAQFQTEAEAKRIFLRHEIPERDVPLPTKKLKKKKKSVSKTKTASPSNTMAKRGFQGGQPHYRLNLADIPFITGTSTSPSHAVSANMQRLLHGLKHHSPLYCNEDFISERKNTKGHSPDNSSDEKEQVTSSTEEDLTDLMVALQDEFGKLTFEHQVLVKQMSSTGDAELRKELQRELDTVVGNMELKGDQITTVRRHRAKLEKSRRGNRKKSQRKPSEHQRPASVPRRTMPRSHGNPASAHTSPRNDRTRASQVRHKRLALLRDVRQVHSALRKDDLSWD